MRSTIKIKRTKTNILKEHWGQDLREASTTLEHGLPNPLYKEGTSSPSRSIAQAVLESCLKAQLAITQQIIKGL